MSDPLLRRQLELLQEKLEERNTVRGRRPTELESTRLTLLNRSFRPSACSTTSSISPSPSLARSRRSTWPRRPVSRLTRPGTSSSSTSSATDLSHPRAPTLDRTIPSSRTRTGATRSGTWRACGVVATRNAAGRLQMAAALVAIGSTTRVTEKRGGTTLCVPSALSSVLLTRPALLQAQAFAVSGFESKLASQKFC